MVMNFVEPVPEKATEDAKSEQQAKKDAEIMKNEQMEIEKEETKAAEKKAKEEAEQKAKLEAEAEEKAKAEKETKAEAEAESKAKEESRVSELGLEEATVARVVDGDTIETTDGLKVRFVGVNTPE